MKSPLELLWKLTCAACLATLLAQAGLLGLAWQRGWLNRDRLQRAKEAFYGVQRRDIVARLTSATNQDGAAIAEKSSLERAMRISDLPLRSVNARRDSVEMGVERNSLQIDQSRYEQTRIGFDRALNADIKRLETAAMDALQGLLEQLQPQDAKEHLMLLLTAPGDNDTKQSLTDTVTVMRRLSPDRRRKIFSEFQSAEEAAQVEAMLRRIREVESTVAEAPAADASSSGAAQPAAPKSGAPPP